DIAPRATHHIADIIDITKKLIEKGFAYEVNGSVFFRVRKFEAYGKLSGKNIDDLVSGIRVEVDDEKEDALDFALWKAAKPLEPTWDSPWGPGRPGWHIECSAMSARHLGTSFDIHAGGSDLIFPHHENEIAQSECANSVKYVNYWLHNGMIKIENQKMSKSLGNFATIADLVKIYHPELIRFFILSAQYRQSLDFSKAALTKSAEGLDRIYGALEKYESAKGRPETVPGTPDTGTVEIYRQRFMSAMGDDLNTPQAIAVLFDLTKMMNSSGRDDSEGYFMLRQLGGILGILQTPAAQWFKVPRIAKEEEGLSDEAIEALLEKRIQARTEKDWALADKIRDQLNEASIQLEDRDGKTFWQRK
ncbi:MAG: cysteine--tRNA ligase, partial [Deltaproteobacteria bacterium]|nr:cysteine--tRNA ligase [Deltaproteobacteria bacterium]